MRREYLYVAPGEADEIRLAFCDDLPDHAAAPRHWIQRQVEDALTHIRLSSMNKIGQVGDTDRVHLFARQEDIKDGIHRLQVDK